MKEDLINNLHEAAYENKKKNEMMVNNVKEQMNVLNEDMEERRRALFDTLVQKFTEQKTSEQDFILKKEELLQSKILKAKERYEAQIQAEWDNADRYQETIIKLEIKEQDMITRLKNTQTQHASYLEDMERINRNINPKGPLSDLEG